MLPFGFKGLIAPDRRRWIPIFIIRGLSHLRFVTIFFHMVRLPAPLPNPNLEHQASMFISPGSKMAQLYPLAPGTHFRRLLRHALATLWLFLFPNHHAGVLIIIYSHIFTWNKCFVKPSANCNSRYNMNVKVSGTTGCSGTSELKRSALPYALQYGASPWQLLFRLLNLKCFQKLCDQTELNFLLLYASVTSPASEYLCQKRGFSTADASWIHYLWSLKI